MGEKNKTHTSRTIFVTTANKYSKTTANNYSKFTVASIHILYATNVVFVTTYTNIGKCCFYFYIWVAYSNINLPILVMINGNAVELHLIHVLFKFLNLMSVSIQCIRPINALDLRFNCVALLLSDPSSYICKLSNNSLQYLEWAFKQLIDLLLQSPFLYFATIHFSCRYWSYSICIRLFT